MGSVLLLHVQIQVQEFGHMGTLAGIAYAEGAVLLAVGDAIFHHPADSIVIGAAGDIREAGVALHRRLSRIAVQEQRHMASGTRIIDSEVAVLLAIGDALLHSPADCPLKKSLLAGTFMAVWIKRLRPTP